MKHYIIHCEAYVERREKMEAQLEKFNIQDVEWVTTFPREQLGPLQHINPYMSLGYFSNNMKYYDVFNRMVAEQVPEAIIFEDDAILWDLYDETKIPKIPYVRLGLGLFKDIESCSHNPKIVLNNGGSEACYITLEFADAYLKNGISLKWMIDIEHQAFLVMYRYHIICVPMCWQLFEGGIIDNKKNPMTWTEFIDKYPSFKKYSFQELKDGTKGIPIE